MRGETSEEDKDRLLSIPLAGKKAILGGKEKKTRKGPRLWFGRPGRK